MSLRDATIRYIADKPHLQEHILPILEKMAALDDPDVMDWLVQGEAESMGLDGRDAEATKDLEKAVDKFQRELEKSLKAWFKQNPLKGYLAGQDLGEQVEAFMDADGDYLAFMTLRGEGRTMFDGDLDHMFEDPRKEIRSLANFLSRKMRRYVDDTGGGSVNDAIRDSAHETAGMDMVASARNASVDSAVENVASNYGFRSKGQGTWRKGGDEISVDRWGNVSATPGTDAKVVQALDKAIRAAGGRKMPASPSWGALDLHRWKLASLDAGYQALRSDAIKYASTVQDEELRNKLLDAIVASDKEAAASGRSLRPVTSSWKPSRDLQKKLDEIGKYFQRKYGLSYMTNYDPSWKEAEVYIHNPNDEPLYAASMTIKRSEESDEWDIHISQGRSGKGTGFDGDLAAPLIIRAAEKYAAKNSDLLTAAGAGSRNAAAGRKRKLSDKWRKMLRSAKRFKGIAAGGSFGTFAQVYKAADYGLLESSGGLYKLTEKGEQALKDGFFRA